ncbi:hypothetical protein Nepgr_003886 [Nepenthes gracilis]|uniref:Uncharacterized protein n=1 Tax=Nepenthes gracilis TaxID=150966 RepID=A0AAD3S0F2_NEPGR|nr:hypothetical protein Nepgr_003886 [Nepenthes gracilis]
MSQCNTTKVYGPTGKTLPSTFPSNVPTKGLEPLGMKSGQVMQDSSKNKPLDSHNSKLVDGSIAISSNSFAILQPDEDPIHHMISQHSDLNTTLVATAHVDDPLNSVAVGPTSCTLEMSKHCPNDPSPSVAFSYGENSFWPGPSRLALTIGKSGVDSDFSAVIESKPYDLVQGNTPSGITDGSEKNDVIESAELDLGPSLGGVEDDMRTLTHSDLERESRGESPLKNDGAGQIGSSRVQRELNCDPPLPEDGQLVGEPPGPSTTSNPSVTRSSRLTARRVPTTSNEAGSSSHAECLPPVLGCLADVIPLEAGVTADAVDCCIAGWFGGRSDLCFGLWGE